MRYASSLSTLFLVATTAFSPLVAATDSHGSTGAKTKALEVVSEAGSPNVSQSNESDKDDDKASPSNFAFPYLGGHYEDTETVIDTHPASRQESAFRLRHFHGMPASRIGRMSRLHLDIAPDLVDSIDPASDANAVTAFMDRVSDLVPASSEVYLIAYHGRESALSTDLDNTLVKGAQTILSGLRDDVQIIADPAGFWTGGMLANGLRLEVLYRAY
jgi:hypothetical protein